MIVVFAQVSGVAIPVRFEEFPVSPDRPAPFPSAVLYVKQSQDRLLTHEHKRKSARPRRRSPQTRHTGPARSGRLISIDPFSKQSSTKRRKEKTPAENTFALITCSRIFVPPVHFLYGNESGPGFRMTRTGVVTARTGEAGTPIGPVVVNSTVGTGLGT